jgi:anti-sigma factor RsiW
MNTCRNILPLLEWLAAGELEDDRRQQAEEHLRDCQACRRELAGWRSLLDASAQPAAATAAELQAIDWESVTAKI